MIKLKDNINENHNLYIVRVYNKETSLIKFGYSSTILNRLVSYYNANPLTELVGTYYREDALDFELYVHKMIQSAKRREWYDEDKLEEILNYINNEAVVDSSKPDMPYQKRAPTYIEMVEIYNKTNSMVENYSNEYNRLIIDVQKAFTIDQAYSSTEAKSILKKVYNKYKLTRTPKATDLKEFFKVKSVDVNRVRCTKILSKLN